MVVEAFVVMALAVRRTAEAVTTYETRNETRRAGF